MAKFTVRVEFHSANADDYENLHSETEAKGFFRLIQSNDGKVYHLPWGEYNREANLDRLQVLESAKRAASAVGREYSILVTESAGRTWHGLELA